MAQSNPQFRRLPLREKRLRAALEPVLKVQCFQSTDSTNTEARRQLAGGVTPPFLLTAQEQTAGRGRQGKSFYSPKNTGIYMTLCLPEQEAQDPISVTSAAAVAVCKAIEALTDRQPKIKWVNDIYLYGKKIAGILCEQEGGAVIIGIGINLTTTDFPEDIPNAGALGKGNGIALTAAVVNQLCRLYGKGYAAFLEDYRSRFLLNGEAITFYRNGAAKNAVVRGIDDTCGLCVLTEDGEELTLRSGEITVRKQQYE